MKLTKKLGPKFILTETVSSEGIVKYNIKRRCGLFYESERSWLGKEMKQFAIHEFNKICEAYLNRNKKVTSKVLMKSEF